MKLFTDAINAEDTDDVGRTAMLCVEAGIRIVRLARRALREAPASTLSHSRLRALAFLDDHPAACLSDLAEHLIVGSPTASKLVDDLVRRRLLRRSPDVSDRRRLTLRVTPSGRRALLTAARPGQDRLKMLLERLSETDRGRVEEGLRTLLPLLESAGAATAVDAEDADG